jgi:hypothetical protein
VKENIEIRDSVDEANMMYRWKQQRDKAEIVAKRLSRPQALQHTFVFLSTKRRTGLYRDSLIKSSTSSGGAAQTACHERVMTRADPLLALPPEPQPPPPVMVAENNMV